jgi:hypothetical protein
MELGRLKAACLFTLSEGSLHPKDPISADVRVRVRVCARACVQEELLAPQRPAGGAACDDARPRRLLSEPPSLHHPCLQEGYSARYKRLSVHGAFPDPPDVTLVGR